MRERIEGIDVLRGLAMVVMALDHTRDYFGDLRLDPHDVGSASPALFFTRWITHFCAPVFVFLAGVSAYLRGRRADSPGEHSRFLLKRGLWLIALEFVVVGLAWQLTLTSGRWFLQVIAAIGVGFVALAGLSRLPALGALLVGAAVVGGHNQLDGVALSPETPHGWLWHLLHVQGVLPLPGEQVVWVMYPLLPWVGVMALGYGAGAAALLPRARRRRATLGAGLALTLLFLALRAGNLYGDPLPWEAQDGAVRTVASFLNCQKYPPSLLFVAMTLGPALVLLALLDREPGRLLGSLRTFGRVPLFYYLLHLFFLSVGSLVYYRLRSGEWFRTLTDFPFPADYGNGLGAVYLVWAVLVLALYPLCRWFAGVKRRSTASWLSYL